MKQLTIKDVTITVEAYEEDTPVRGNASASGDDKQDKRIEDSIIRQLNSGNQWAWCCVKVTVEYNGIEATDYLGGCSYKNEKDFIKNSGYYDDMVKTCIEEIQYKCETIVNDFTAE